MGPEVNFPTKVVEKSGSFEVVSCICSLPECASKPCSLELWFSFSVTEISVPLFSCFQKVQCCLKYSLNRGFPQWQPAGLRKIHLHHFNHQL